MTPWQLAKDSESSHQIALFCFLAQAQSYGFEVAKSVDLYKPVSPGARGFYTPVPELAFLHHIPNGGSRGDTAKSRAIAGGQLKAEGVKAGVFDLCWPIARGNFHGMYIEMKRPAEKNTKSGGLSDAQVAFRTHLLNNGYFAVVCYSWQEAAEVIQHYWEIK